MPPVICNDGVHTSWVTTNAPDGSRAGISRRDLDAVAVRLPDGVDTLQIDTPSDRYGDAEDWSVTVSCPLGTLTVRELLQAIYRCYQTPLSQRQVREMLRDSDDLGGYLEDASARMCAGQVVPRVDIMGDLLLYEGLHVTNRACLSVCLGT